MTSFQDFRLTLSNLIHHLRPRISSKLSVGLEAEPLQHPPGTQSQGLGGINIRHPRIQRGSELWRIPKQIFPITCRAAWQEALSAASRCSLRNAYVSSRVGRRAEGKICGAKSGNGFPGGSTFVQRPQCVPSSSIDATYELQEDEHGDDYDGVDKTDQHDDRGSSDRSSARRGHAARRVRRTGRRAQGVLDNEHVERRFSVHEDRHKVVGLQEQEGSGVAEERGTSEKVFEEGDEVEEEDVAGGLADEPGATKPEPQSPIYSGSRFSRRTLGVDYGARRTGVAVTCGGLAPRPLAVLHESDTFRLIGSIISIAEEERADEIVVGFPRRPSTYAGGGNRGRGGGGAMQAGSTGTSSSNVYRSSAPGGAGWHGVNGSHRANHAGNGSGDGRASPKRPFTYGDAGISGHARQCRRFAQAVERVVSPRGWRVVLFDESHSSQDAMEDMLAFGSNRHSRKEQIDAFAAAVLLKNYFAADCVGEVVTPPVPLSWKEQRVLARSHAPPVTLDNANDAGEEDHDDVTGESETENTGTTPDNRGDGVKRRRRRRRRKKAADS